MWRVQAHEFEHWTTYTETENIIARVHELSKRDKQPMTNDGTPSIKQRPVFPVLDNDEENAAVVVYTQVGEKGNNIVIESDENEDSMVQVYQ